MRCLSAVFMLEFPKNNVLPIGVGLAPMYRARGPGGTTVLVRRFESRCMGPGCKPVSDSEASIGCPLHVHRDFYLEGTWRSSTGDLVIQVMRSTWSQKGCLGIC